MEMSVSVSEGSGCCCCIEAETEERVLVVEIKVGMVLESLERKKIDGVRRRVVKGNALRNRDAMLFFFFFG